MILPAGPPLASLLCGVLLGWFFPGGRPAYLVGSLLAVPGALGAFLRGGRILPLLGALLLLAALRTSGRLDPQLGPGHVAWKATGRPVLLEAILVDRPRVRRSYTLLPVRARRIRSPRGGVPATGRVDLYLHGRAPRLRPGEILLVETRLRVPRNYGNPGERDRRALSFLRGVYVRGSLRDDAHLVRLGRARGYGFLDAVEGIRDRVRAFIGKVNDPEVRGLLEAWFLGDRSDLGEEIQGAFRRTGLAHLLAISGLHVGLVGLFFHRLWMLLLGRSTAVLRRGWLEKAAAAAAFPVVILYVLVAGLPLTAVRALLLAFLLVGARLLDRAPVPWNALASAALLILLWAPAALFSVSFLLSFAAVAGLLAVSAGWRSRSQLEGPSRGDLPGRRGRGPCTWAWRLFCAGAAAAVATAPLAARFFNRVAPLGLLANLLAVPLVGWVLIPLGLAAVGLGLLWSPAGAPLLGLLEILLRPLIAGMKGLGSVRFSSLRVPAPTVPEMILFYLFFFLVLPAGRRRSRRRWIGLACLALLVGLRAESIHRREASDRLAIHFLSVGQGESILVEFPHGRTLIVDGGPARPGGPDAGRRIVGPFLAHRGLVRLDYLAATHGQADHYGGLGWLGETFRPRGLWIPPESGCEGEGYRRFLEGCSRNGIPVRRLCRSTTPFSIEGVRLEVLNPPRGRAGESPACPEGVNDRSLVIRLTFGRVRVLLTGDIEERTERELLEADLDLRAFLLKVPHHGSSTSSGPAFLDAVGPTVAVLSAGAGNPFGFPSREVVKRYRRRGILLFRTDLDGALRFETDGRSIWVESYGERRRRVSFPGHSGEGNAIPPGKGGRR